jgi:hypothetical protein
MFDWHDLNDLEHERPSLLNQSVPGAIVATKTNILIQAGPPARIEWSDVPFDQGASLGAGLWELLIAVSVTDGYGNPVAYGTSVWFEIFQGAPNGALSIQGNSYTGNGPEVTSVDAGDASVDSLSSIGIAYTLLTYSSALTFNEIIHQANCIGLNGSDIFDTNSMIMPWNEPETDIVTTPGHLDFYLPDTNDFKWANISIRCRDGQGFATPGVEWTFTSDRGTYYDFAVPTFQTDVAVSDVTGYAKIKLKLSRLHGNPSADGVTPGITPVLIEAISLGTSITQRSTVSILRFPFNDPGKK